MIDWTYIPFSIGLIICAIYLVKLLKEKDAFSGIETLAIFLMCLIATILWGGVFIW
jgi:hypothetical protein